MKTIVAMGGTRPQAEREADGLGLVALVTYTTQGVSRPECFKLIEWHKWFDKAFVVEEEGLSQSAVQQEALTLIPVLSTRPRLVLIGKETAEAFGVWLPDSDCRWRWANWPAIHMGIGCDPRPQLFAVVTGQNEDPADFWRALARACKAKRARTN